MAFYADGKKGWVGGGGGRKKERGRIGCRGKEWVVCSKYDEEKERGEGEKEKLRDYY